MVLIELGTIYFAILSCFQAVEAAQTNAGGGWCSPSSAAPEWPSPTASRSISPLP
jgi:hypothetical protein